MTHKLLYPTLAIFCLVLGYFWGSSNQNSSSTGAQNAPSQHSTYTCSMHPQIKLPKMGKCPICFMDLIPLSSQNSDPGPRALKLSASAVALADIQTVKAEKKEASVILDMVGKVSVDTTRISDVITLSDGEVRKLYVNYIGVPVKKGEHLAEIYSPKIFTAAQDYLVIYKKSPDSSGLLKSAETKLKLLGAPDGYIKKIRELKQVPETFTLLSPRNGFVENLVGYEGMWIKAGQLFCRVIDMSHLWIHLDAYEPDLAWIRYGQHVTLKAAALPGIEYDGIISYIPPRINDKTRTTKVRVNVDNSDGKLKPDMFVSASLKANVTAKGSVTSSALKGKWISPMHPEIVKDEPGPCDVCGMALVKAEDLGFSFQSPKELPLLIPVSSVLLTGKRAVVYIKKPGKDFIFEGRDIQLGPKAGDHYVVTSGLKEGDDVVLKGNFKIDSALQIEAKPSMMSSLVGRSSLHPLPVSIIEATHNLSETYLKIQDLLANDKSEGLVDLASTLLLQINSMETKSLNENQNKIFSSLHTPVNKEAKSLQGITDISEYRKQFKLVSKHMISFFEKVGHKHTELNVMHCPMAGASWLQNNKDIKNPYFGASMLKCGTIESAIPASSLK